MTLYILLALLLLAALAVILWPQRRNTGFVITVSLLFFIAAFSLYRLIGAPDIVPLLAARQERLTQVKDTILRRSADLKTDRNNLGAWVELGESFMETGQFSAATDAFKHAVLLSNGNPALLIAYAQSMISGADGKVTDDAKKALEMAQLQQPQNEEVRYWLIVRQLQDGKTEEAMTAMKALYRSLPEKSPLRAMIDKQIGKK